MQASVKQDGQIYYQSKVVVPSIVETIGKLGLEVTTATTTTTTITITITITTTPEATPETTIEVLDLKETATTTTATEDLSKKMSFVQSGMNPDQVMTAIGIACTN